MKRAEQNQFEKPLQIRQPTPEAAPASNSNEPPPPEFLSRAEPAVQDWAMRRAIAEIRAEPRRPMLDTLPTRKRGT